MVSLCQSAEGKRSTINDHFGHVLCVIRNADADEPWSRVRVCVHSLSTRRALHNGSLATNFMLISAEDESCFYSPTGSFRLCSFQFRFQFQFLYGAHLHLACCHANTHTQAHTHTLWASDSHFSGLVLLVFGFPFDEHGQMQAAGGVCSHVRFPNMRKLHA